MTTDAGAIFERHIAAFNDRDLDALLAGFADDALWVTGKYTCRGHVELRELFAGAFSSIAPRLEVRSVLAVDDLVAAELVEYMVVDDHEVTAPIAGFYTVRDGRILRAKIYREGSADIPAVEAGGE